MFVHQRQKREAEECMTNARGPRAFRRRKREITANYPILAGNTPTVLTHHLPSVCLTPKCFPAWSEARGLKSARLSRIGCIPWPALLRPFVHPLREARKSVIIVIGEPRKGRKSWREKSILFLASDRNPDIG